jgi:hypothetical protein
MRICWRVTAVALMLFSVVSPALPADEIERHEPEIDVFASMTGKCSTLKVAGRDFQCTTVAFSHSPGGRSGFTVPLNDPDDATHIITFSGVQNKRDRDDLYELSVDRMLLKSKDRPKVDGLPVPSTDLSTGNCQQIGNISKQQVSSISCLATDENGARYEFQFESDGSPIKVRTIRIADPIEEERLAKVVAEHVEQLKCGHLAEVKGILPRDRTEFILRCMDE